MNKAKWSKINIIIRIFDWSMVMGLKEDIARIEQKVGAFSNYQTTTGKGESIVFKNKPAQKFLGGIGVDVSNTNDILSKMAKGGALPEKGNKSVTISSFDPKRKSNLKITGERIDRLRGSAKVYVNTEIIDKGLYADSMAKGFDVQTEKKAGKKNSYWKNMAVAVCHVQEVDLLVSSEIKEGKSITAPGKGTINKNDPALLLLSAPALNCNPVTGVGQHLSNEDRVEYIKGMYRNLFYAAQQEGRNYIALPAAGLGVFQGNPEEYFNALMTVAKEYSGLNIIYNLGAAYKQAGQFDQLLGSYELTNLVRTDRDVMILAHELTQQGMPCAFHNPSDPDVVLGVYDVGEYWKNGAGAQYVGEEHIGVMTTAAMNSRGLNPDAYQHIVEHAPSQKKDVSMSDEIIQQPEQSTPQSHKDMSYSFSNKPGSLDPERAKSLKEKITILAKQKIYYTHANLDETRFHFYKVSVDTVQNVNEEFKKKYNKLKGDILKTQVLLDFKKDIDAAKTPEELNKCIRNFEVQGGKELLNTKQGIMSKVFSIETDSMKAYKRIVQEATDRVNLPKNSPL